MKHYEDMLKRVDRQIDAKRREMAVLRVQISELEDTHKNLMRMAEEEIAAANVTAIDEARLLNGNSKAGALLIARDRKAVKMKRRRPKGTKREKMRAKVEAMLDGGAVLTSTEIGDRCGLALGGPRHELRQTLTAMLNAGELTRSGTARNYAYSLPGGQP